MPFVNMDWFFSKFPYLARDKVLYMTRLLQFSFAGGVAFVFLFINPPHSGADYDNVSKSWYYKWTHDSLEKSGKLHENLRIKRDSFYSPGGPVDPAIKIAEESG
jgi:hypothetical protein